MLVLVLVLVLDILLEQEASDMERHEVSNEEWGILSSVLEAPRMGRGRRLENIDHEKLDVYKAAIELTAWAGELLDGSLKSCRIKAVDQLDRASTSVLSTSQRETASGPPRIVVATSIQREGRPLSVLHVLTHSSPARSSIALQ